MNSILENWISLSLNYDLKFLHFVQYSSQRNFSHIHQLHLFQMVIQVGIRYFFQIIIVDYHLIILKQYLLSLIRN